MQFVAKLTASHKLEKVRIQTKKIVAIREAFAASKYFQIELLDLNGVLVV